MKNTNTFLFIFFFIQFSIPSQAGFLTKVFINAAGLLKFSNHVNNRDEQASMGRDSMDSSFHEFSDKEIQEAQHYALQKSTFEIINNANPSMDANFHTFSDNEIETALLSMLEKNIQELIDKSNQSASGIDHDCAEKLIKIEQKRLNIKSKYFDLSKTPLDKELERSEGGNQHLSIDGILINLPADRQRKAKIIKELKRTYNEFFDTGIDQYFYGHAGATSAMAALKQNFALNKNIMLETEEIRWIELDTTRKIVTANTSRWLIYPNGDMIDGYEVTTTTGLKDKKPIETIYHRLLR